MIFIEDMLFAAFGNELFVFKNCINANNKFPYFIFK